MKNSCRHLTYLGLLGLLLASVHCGRIAGSARVASESSPPTFVGPTPLPLQIQLDETFGTAGRTVTSISSGLNNDDTGYGSAIQSDGKILVVGATGVLTVGSSFVARYTRDGILDSEFSNGGKFIISFPNIVFSNGLRVLEDKNGKILIGAYVADATNTVSFALMRLKADGTRDTAYGVDGYSIFNFGTVGTTTDSHLNELALQPDGKLLAIGVAYNNINGTPTYHCAVARLLDNGSLDPAFGGTGKVIIPIGVQSHCVGAVTTNDGKIVVSGGATSAAGANTSIGIARLTADGVLDPSFGSAGKSTVSFGLGQYTAYAVAAVDNGNYAVLARIDSGGTKGLDFGLGLIAQSGSLVSVTTVDFGSLEDRLNDFIVLPGGKEVVLAGSSKRSDDSGFDLAFVRLKIGQPFDEADPDQRKLIRGFLPGFDEKAISICLQGPNKFVSVGLSKDRLNSPFESDVLLSRFIIP